MQTTKIIRTIFTALVLVTFLFSTTYAEDKKANQQEVKIKTSAFSWMCKNKIEFNLKEKEGIKDAELDLNTQIVTIKFDPTKTDTAKIRKNIEELGYEAKIVAKDSESSENTKK